MSNERVRRDLSLALEAFYANGQHTFWNVFDETPRAAIAALAQKPEVFGRIDPDLVGVDKRRLFARALCLARKLIA